MEIYKDCSFIKVLAEPVSYMLLFPDEFVRKYGEMLPQEAFLMTEEKYSRGWKVKVTRLHSGRLCFEQGWPLFVDENPQIRASDLAVFQLVDASTFHVSIFGYDGLRKPSSTLRRPPSPSPPQEDVERRKTILRRPPSPSPPQEDVENNLRKNPIDCSQPGHGRGVEVGMKSFTTTSLARHHYYYMNIPVSFAKKTGIADRKTINLKVDETGVIRELKLSMREKDGRLCLGGADWAGFWKDNCLTIGNKLTFSIVGDDYGTLHMSREGLIIPTPPSNTLAGRPRKF